ncbi:MAG: T9SS C-terminal target domain-containing protein [Calditrichaeota bacterium]|nr:MAG: T9SS C-terminal target domain-containing protein [Calditrichota bacterium]
MTFLIIILIFGLIKSVFAGPGVPEHFKNNRNAPLPTPAEIVPGKIIVKLKPFPALKTTQTFDENIFYANKSLADKLQAFSISKIKKIFPESTKQVQAEVPDLSTIFELEFDPQVNPLAVATIFSQDPWVEYAEPRYYRYLHFTPNDSLFFSQDHLSIIQATAAWDITQGDTSVVIAIVDTGVDWAHPDLEANIWHNPGEIPDNGIDDDGNGYVDDVLGWDFGDEDSDPANRSTSPVGSHGTEVAGTAAAVTNNSTGIAGIAFRCKIMPIKVISDQASDQGQIFLGFEGIKYAADQGAQIINASWGGPRHSLFEQDIINYARARGSLVIASAGNGNNPGKIYPAAYSGVLAVTATTKNDLKANFSTFGPWVDLAAPGVSILTTTRDNHYRFVSGTSFSAPLASGVAALVKSLHPDWTAGEIGEQIRVSADNINGVNPAFQNMLGHGRLNALRALTVESPAIRIEKIKFLEITGDGDEVLEPGERYAVQLALKNYLADANDVMVSLHSSDSAILVRKGLAHLGDILKGQVVTNQDSLIFSIHPHTPLNREVALLLDIVANGGTYLDRDHFPVTIAPLLVNHNTGKVLMTVTSLGNLGFSDFPANLQGNGFVFNNDGKNLLFEGALLVATGPNQVSDMARNSTLTGKDEDFQLLTGGNIVLRTPGELADQQSRARFDDSRNPQAIGVAITQESFSYNTPPYDGFVILKYTIKNKNVTDIEDLYVGLFLDWDIDAQTLKTNLVDFDFDLSLGYVYSPELSIYAGVKVLSELGATSYRAINNEEDLFDALLFSEAEKFHFLTEGFKKTRISTPGDHSHMIGTGPFKLAPGDSVVVGFAVLAGHGLDELKKHARAAQSKWNKVIAPNLSMDLPTTFVLYQNYPNPFNPSTTIKYFVPEITHVTLKIYNVLGQELTTLVDEIQGRGDHKVIWNGTDSFGRRLPSGVYFYRLEHAKVKKSQKMILLH